LYFYRLSGLRANYERKRFAESLKSSSKFLPGELPEFHFEYGPNFLTSLWYSSRRASNVQILSGMTRSNDAGLNHIAEAKTRQKNACIWTILTISLCLRHHRAANVPPASIADLSAIDILKVRAADVCQTR
jgi:hypothetical protein